MGGQQSSWERWIYLIWDLGKKFTKIEAYAGIAERLVRDLEIEEALQDEIKQTLEHKNQSYVDWCALLDKEKKKNKVKLTVTYDMGWQKR